MYGRVQPLDTLAGKMASNGIKKVIIAQASPLYLQVFKSPLPSLLQATGLVGFAVVPNAREVGGSLDPVAR